MNQPREDWRRLASYVVSARIAAGIRDRRALEAVTGVSHRTLGKLENGQPVSPDTLAAVERAVGWKPDSARQILHGGEPAPAQADGTDRRTRAQVAEEFLGSLTAEDVAEIGRSVIERFRSRVAEDERPAANGT